MMKMAETSVIFMQHLVLFFPVPLLMSYLLGGICVQHNDRAWFLTQLNTHCIKKKPSDAGCWWSSSLGFMQTTAARSSLQLINPYEMNGLSFATLIMFSQDQSAKEATLSFWVYTIHSLLFRLSALWIKCCDLIMLTSKHSLIISSTILHTRHIILVFAYLNPKNLSLSGFNPQSTGSIPRHCPCWRRFVYRYHCTGP